MRARFENVGIVSRAQATEIGTGGPRGARQRPRARRPVRSSGGLASVRAGAGGGVAGRRRLCPRPRALAGDPALGGVPRASSSTAPPDRRNPQTTSGRRAPDTLAVALVEGWRGEVCHVALTDAAGRFRRYKIIDPSFHNWTGLALAMRGAGDLGFPALQQELQPLLLRIRPLSPIADDAMFVTDTAHSHRLQARLRDDGLPRRSGARLARPPRRRAARGRREVRRRLQRVRARLPDRGDHAPADGKPVALDLGPLHLLRRVRDDVPDEAPSPRPAITAWRRESARGPACWAIPGKEEVRLAAALDEKLRKLFGRSLRLRQVSAGGCNACEADTNVLGTIGWDLGRFGIQFVASPRHADGLLITGAGVAGTWNWRCRRPRRPCRIRRS